MNDEQFKYHAEEFFNRFIKGIKGEIGSFSLDRTLRKYHYENDGYYGFIKDDRLEFDCIYRQLVQDNKLEIVSRKDKEIIYRIVTE